MTEIDFQKCRTCNMDKFVEEFHLSRYKTPESQCKVCKHEEQKARRRKQRAEGTLAKPKYNREQRRFWSMKAKYNLTKENFYKIYVNQKGSCRLCGKVFDMDSLRPFHVDHDHSCCSGVKSCGKCVRGLLCGNCNLFLGFLKDDTKKMRKAIEYIEGFSA